MPLSSERGAPSYDPAKPATLRAYFADLDLLFWRHAVVVAQEKKHFACKYGPSDQSEMWETLPAFTEDAKSYEEFRAQVYDLYPGAKDGRRFTEADLTNAMERWRRAQVTTAATYAEFYREYSSISRYLIAKGRLSIAEASRGIFYVLPQTFAESIRIRLQIKHVDCDADHLYSLSEIHEAAMWVYRSHSVTRTMGLPSTATQPSAPSVPMTMAVPAGSTPPGMIKVEDIAVVLDRFSSRLMSALQRANLRQPVPNIVRPIGRLDDRRCHYCGDMDCRINSCAKAEEDIRAGEVIRRATDGRLALPNGLFLPRRFREDLPTMGARIKEWHRRHPGQKAEVAQEISRDTERIKALERELYALRQAAPAMIGDQVTGNSIASGSAIPSTIRRSPPPPLPSQAPDSLLPMLPEIELPLSALPSSQAQGDAYPTPQQHVTGAPFIARPPLQSENQPAYRICPPVYDPEVAKSVFERSLAATSSMTLSRRELLAISPEVDSLYEELVTSACIPNTAGGSTMAVQRPEVPSEPANVCAYASILQDSRLVHFAEDNKAGFLPEHTSVYTVQTGEALTAAELSQVPRSPYALDGREEHYVIPDDEDTAKAIDNGVVDRLHLDARQALYKAAKEDAAKQAVAAHSAFWSEDITPRKCIGYSPYFAAIGCQPTIPLDIVESTYPISPPTTPLRTRELVARQAVALRTWQEDWQRPHTKVFAARNKAAKCLERKHTHNVHVYHFPPRPLGRIRNIVIRRCLQYLGPIAALFRNRGGVPYYVRKLRQSTTTGEDDEEDTALYIPPRTPGNIGDDLEDEDAELAEAMRWLTRDGQNFS